MQIKAMIPGQGVPDATDTHAQRIAEVKAKLSGQPLPERVPSGDPQVDRIKAIKMRTNVSPDRPTGAPVVEAAATPETPESAISDDSSNEQVEAADDTKPLSPQFAALAKQKRALQVKESELAKREAELATKSSGPNMEDYVSKAELLANPMRIFEAGVTYDQLTEAILSGQSPSANQELNELKQKIADLEKGVDSKLSERDQLAEQQVLDSFKREAEKLAFSGDEYELVRETKSIPDVVELIHKTYKESGEVMDVEEAMRLVEEDLLTESLKVANYKKIQSRLSAQSAPQKPQGSDQKSGIKTLTNRDTARPIDDRRARAIAAMQGNLKR